MESILIRKAIAGDTQALNTLVDKYKNLAFSVAFRITNNHEDAQDITQDSFLKVLEKLHQFREESRFSTWLFRIVYNQAMMLMRKRKKSIEYLDSIILEYAYEEENNHTPDLQKDLNRAIDELKPVERNIIDLFYLGEKSIKEIHQITGMSTSNVKVVLHRTRAKLRKKIQDGQTRS